jgi:hypothetical protein
MEMGTPVTGNIFCANVYHSSLDGTSSIDRVQPSMSHMRMETESNLQKRDAHRSLVGTPERKRPIERPRREWVGKITMDLVEIELVSVDWIGLAQDRYRWRALVNSVMNLLVP